MSQSLTPAKDKSQYFFVTRYGVAVVLAVLVSYWVGRSAQIRPDINAGLRVENLDFGEAWEHPAHPWTFTVFNPTNESISILDLPTSCDCTSVEPTSLTVSPGQKAKITVSMNLSSAFSRSDISHESGPPTTKAPFEVRVVPDIAGISQPPVAWTIKGSVKRAFKLVPSSIVFGHELIRGKPMLRERVAVIALAPGVELSRVSCPQEFGRADILAHDPDTKTYTVSIAPHQELKPGVHNSMLTLVPSANSTALLSKISYPIWAKVVDETRLLPDSLCFGARALGNDSRDEFVVAGADGFPLTVTFDNTFADDITVTAHPSHRNVGVVTLKATRLGHQEFRLPIRVTGDGIDKTLFLNVSYHGYKSQGGGHSSHAN